MARFGSRYPTRDYSQTGASSQLSELRRFYLAGIDLSHGGLLKRREIKALRAHTLREKLHQMGDPGPVRRTVIRPPLSDLFNHHCEVRIKSASTLKPGLYRPWKTVGVVLTTTPVLADHRDRCVWVEKTKEE